MNNQDGVGFYTKIADCVRMVHHPCAIDNPADGPRPASCRRSSMYSPTSADVGAREHARSQPTLFWYG